MLALGVRTPAVAVGAARALADKLAVSHSWSDPSGRTFQSKPEVARFLNVGEPLDEAGDEPASDSDSMKNFIDDVLDSD